ncbi:GlsB/YeaQ/YmgE family stress response membrane protein [Sulfitobacter sp. D35]|uniref:GlsB/YeaQ/YmgE family stress response membrane protein n=1 Tax=Sulfitobacter sp. D35 TaxID=3083252 RepID=UPI00296E349E|nr:GlsB/YeaQ/YmgE family stress response membrane protein [Sulfitobacter sp. D35]MDW4498448.1 GlsB/YeaQ/YmgE family stress response membrane protein [Sulfitobacter sp. D35]
MEGFLDALGATALILLVIVGAMSGYIASRIAGGRMPLYIAVGVVAAVATPFILAGLGLSVLAAGGLILLLVAATAGAIVVLLIVRALIR